MNLVRAMMEKRFIRSYDKIDELYSRTHMARATTLFWSPTVERASIPTTATVSKLNFGESIVNGVADITAQISQSLKTLAMAPRIGAATS